MLLKTTRTVSRHTVVVCYEKENHVMQTNDHADERAVATALDGVIVRGEQNLLTESAAPGFEGAHAALETFYFAFNTRSADLYQQIWADHPLVQVSSPLGGIVRGHATIAALAQRMASAPARVETTPARVETTLDDIVVYVTPEMVVFTGREHGSYTAGGEQEAMIELPEVRSICVLRIIAEQGGWRQVYHLVSLADADQLARYQRAMRGA
jgi:SnoaL-like domain